MLGILTLDTAFPRIPGDVGCAATFDFPVRYATPRGALVDLVVHRRDDSFLGAFMDAARGLVDDGAIGIATTCGFLARWQPALAEALPVPVFASALLAAGKIASALPRGKRLGIVTYSAADLDEETLSIAGVPAGTPVEGVAPDGVFARTIRFGAPGIDASAMAEDVAAAARALVGRHPDVGALLLECANMPPYRDAVTAATGRPVHDAAQLVRAFHAGLARR
jgi:hypothetical protein